MIQKLLYIVKTSIDLLSYLIAPPLCYICHTYLLQRTILCDACDVQLLPIAPKLFVIGKNYTLSVHAICRYDGIIKKMLLAKHRSDHVMLCGLADLMWKKTVVSHLKVDCFIPIPLHWTRKLKRGFNQAELLAQRLAQHKQVAMYNMVLRIKRTEYQARLEKTERKANVKDAFVIKKGFNITGKHVVLVDDLCTTGSTAIAVAQSLAQYKPASIELVVACRAL